MDDQLITILILLDFSKAFDNVSHKILLNKMIGMGFSENCLQWFKTYLVDRRQAVLDKNVSDSSWKKIKSGFP